jgi:hypothetical protein
VKGPLFHYGGPFHFKPPFTIGGKERAGAPTSPGRTVSGGGGGGAVTAPQPAPQPTAGVIRVAPVSATKSTHPAAVWFLFPALLLAIAAVAAVLFEPKDRPVTDRPAGPGVD